jgi:UDP-N-acetylmuramate dehydrogenase
MIYLQHMRHVENVSTKELSALKIGGAVQHYFEIEHPDEIALVDAFASEHSLPLLIIGAGTNSIFSDSESAHVLARLRFSGITVTTETTTHTTITVAAGENWDDLVEWSVAHDLSGLEALSLIPGTVGAAPVQNIGAYGSELTDTCTHVHVYNRTTKPTETLTAHQCGFSYRDSIFKQNPKQYIITHVTLQLCKATPTFPQ